MNELEKLRPEVRSALGAIVRADVCRDPVSTDAFDIIRAELLRLATIEADALIALDCEHDWQVEHKRAEKAEYELAEMKQTFDLRWKADMRAIEQWRVAHPGNELVMPDHADLCVWLMGELDEVNARIANAPIGRLTSKSGACDIVEMDGANVFGSNAYGAKVRIVPDVTG